MVPPLPLARELKVAHDWHPMRVSIGVEAPSVSWLRRSRSRWLPLRQLPPERRPGLPIRPANSCFAVQTVTRAEFLRLTVARRRRLFTVFPSRSLGWLFTARFHLPRRRYRSSTASLHSNAQQPFC